MYYDTSIYTRRALNRAALSVKKPMTEISPSKSSSAPRYTKIGAFASAPAPPPQYLKLITYLCWKVGENRDIVAQLVKLRPDAVA